MGKREPRQMLIAERKLWGHPSGGPTRVFDQSKARIRSPISPPPARNLLDGWSVLTRTSTKTPTKGIAPAQQQVTPDRPGRFPLQRASMSRTAEVGAHLLPSQGTDRQMRIKVRSGLLVGGEDEPCLDVDLWMKRLMPGRGWRCCRARACHQPGGAASFNRLIEAFLADVERGSWRPRDSRAAVGRAQVEALQISGSAPR